MRVHFSGMQEIFSEHSRVQELGYLAVQVTKNQHSYMRSRIPTSPRLRWARQVRNDEVYTFLWRMTVYNMMPKDTMTFILMLIPHIGISAV
jgi:hypothetical protein